MLVLVAVLYSLRSRQLAGFWLIAEAVEKSCGMFYSLFGNLQERGFDHFMILESPALPIRKHWLDAIAKAATQEKCALNRSDSLGLLRASAVINLALLASSCFRAFGPSIAVRAAQVQRFLDSRFRASLPRRL